MAESGPTHSVAVGQGMANLDRKAMEAARLARLQKKRSASEALSTEFTSSGREKHAKPDPARPESQSSSSHAGDAKASLAFPKGAVKLTWCFGYARADDLKIEEVLDKRKLKTAVLSSWQIDSDWLFSKLDLGKTKTVLVMQSKDPKEQEALIADSLAVSKSLRLCFPPMRAGQFGTMHSKLMLLFYDDHLRICIPSANLTSYDWGETGVMENVLWLIDLPRRRADAPASLTPFANDLIHFCQAMGIDKTFADQKESLTEGLKNFDFSQTGHVRLIHTIPQPRLGDAASTTGFPLLASAARSLLPGPLNNPHVNYSVSSIGSITKDHVATMYKAIQGIDTRMPDGKKQPATPQTSLSQSSACAAFSVHYPSKSTVESSIGKQQAAGTLFMTPIFDKACAAGTFPIESLRDCISQRRGLLSHAKMLVAQAESSSLVYVGSANFSPSAWGTLTFDRKEKRPKLSANNWECGVLLQGTSREGAPHDLDGTPIPVPFQVPGPPYVQDGHETRQPFTQS